MKIGVDLDGVVFNSEMFFMAEGEIYDCRVLKRNSILHPGEPRVQDKYDWTDAEIAGYVERYCLSRDFDVMPCAAKVIGYLQEAGHEIVVVSARGQFDSREIEIAKDKLAEAGIRPDRMIWGHLDKRQICKDAELSVMIDDRYEVCHALGEMGIHALYFRMAGRQKIEQTEYVKEVNNWGEVYRQLDRLGYFEGVV